MVYGLWCVVHLIYLVECSTITYIFGGIRFERLKLIYKQVGKQFLKIYIETRLCYGYTTKLIYKYKSSE